MQLRADRDAARMRVLELESILAELEKQMSQQQLPPPQAGKSRSPFDGAAAAAPAGPLAARGRTSSCGGSDGDEGEMLAAVQSHMAHGQQLLDVRSSLQQELEELQVGQ